MVGPLPEELQDKVAYQAAIMPSVKEVEPLNALINYLRTPEAIGVIKAMGMSQAKPNPKVLNRVAV